ncbi:S9 family peptidase [Bacteroides heparinolyticus]|uniref:Prolyl tripeptidyl peptidase n=4 Tax=Prevotella heparinolytica TaxID=28113 RepID=A0A449I2A7_9BACE|nr:S9 family peptidase [Bacteroides heparinolyticus]MCI6211987.1 S9 family peptidase [Bacteroides heparinolyticus]VFB13549.1 prolyl tripeptidyl peptidase [Bacteroides heparinolyticus]
MNKKTITEGMLALLFAMSAPSETHIMAQERNAETLKRPTLEDLIPGGETYRYTKNLYGLQWWGDVCIKPDMDDLKTIDLQSGKETVLVTRETVNRALKEAGLKELSHLYSVSLPWAEKKELLLPLAQKYAVYNWQTGQLTYKDNLPKEPAANYDLSTESRNLAYTVKNNLYVNGRRITDEPLGVVCGQSVHRNEFGISKGTFWSPAGDLLAFYRMDERMVTEYPLVDITARVGELNAIRYPMAGMTSHKVQVGIYNPATEQTVYLNTGDPTDRYFTNIAWAPNGRSLFLIELNRDQNHSKLCQYDAETGELVRVLIEETHPKYVEPQNPILFLPWDDTKFIYRSQRSGYDHLYLYDLGKLASHPQPLTAESMEKMWSLIKAVGKGKSPKEAAGMQLTSGNWIVKDVLGFNVKKKEIIFTATKESPLQSNIYKVNVSNGQITRLDNGEGVHRPRLSASGSYLIDSYSTPDVPRSIHLTATRNGKQLANLLTASNPYEGFDMPSIETGTIKAADGTTDLYYRIVKPADFDPNRKYPAIVYVYGGPHAQMISNGWMNDARGWDLYMANKGYILFSLDNRGSSNRGLEFENVTFRQLGIEECKDQVKGAEFLQSLPYVDGNRIGVHGWSFGGHMTTALMLRHPEIFKVGVAGGPVIDWQYYEVMYGERYMDTPQSNPEGYKATNLKNLAGNLKGRLLIIHDDHDDTCVPQHTLSFMKACVDARTYPDLFIYPGHKHNVLGRDRVHLHEKITRYFEDYL